MSGNNPRKRWVMTVNKKKRRVGGGIGVSIYMSVLGHIYIFNYKYEPPFKAN